jgi:NAD+ synthase
MEDKRKQKVVYTITQFIKSGVRRSGSKGVVIGMSGGIDSSVATCLSVRALGPNGVFGLILPDSSVTPKSDTKHAERLAKELEIGYRIVEVGKTKNQFLRDFPKNKLARANFLARLRMSILYYYAGVMNRLVLGTGDKSEVKLGYFTKYGDAAADLLPIADLYKSEVRELAEFINVPRAIIQKKSSARLWRGQTAEGEIGLAYSKIDSILVHLEHLENGKGIVSSNAHRKNNNNPINRNTKRKIENSSESDVKQVLELIERNKHKHTLPPICKVG